MRNLLIIMLCAHAYAQTGVFPPGTTGSGAGNNTYCADATGSTTTFTCPTPSPTITTLTGLIVSFVPQATNTGTSTLNIGGLGAKTLKQTDGSTNVASGALVGGQTYLFQYDGTNFRQASSSGGSSSAGTAGQIQATDGVGNFTARTLRNGLTVVGGLYIDADPTIVGYLANANTWTQSNTFSNTIAVTGTFDGSGASVTKPIRAVTTATLPGSCVANKEMVLVTDATAGLQLRTCDDTGDGWVTQGASVTGLGSPAGNGLVAWNGSSTLNRTVTSGSASLLTITNGDGVSGNPTITPTTAAATRSCEIVIGDPGLASVALADDNDSPAVCGNKTGATMTITAVECYAATGAPQVRPIINGGSSTSILSGDLTCGTGSFNSGTLNGTPTQAANASIDANITTAGGTAKYIVIRITRTL